MWPAKLRAFDCKIDRMYADPSRAERLRTVLHAINDRIGNFLALKTLLGVGLGVVTWAAMTWMGLGFAGLAGLLVGLLNYIPIVGSVLGVAVPAVLSGANSVSLIWLSVGLSVAQFLNGNVLDPYLMGSLNLSPFVILFSMAVFREFEGTRPLAVLLSRNGRLDEGDA
jgi:predicted PurR-regulated permease PerM